MTVSSIWLGVHPISPHPIINAERGAIEQPGLQEGSWDIKVDVFVNH